MGGALVVDYDSAVNFPKVASCYDKLLGEIKRYSLHVSSACSTDIAPQVSTITLQELRDLLPPFLLKRHSLEIQESVQSSREYF